MQDLKNILGLLEDKSINLCEIKSLILTLFPNLVEIKDIKTKLEPHKIIGNCIEMPMARIKIKKILENHYKK